MKTQVYFVPLVDVSWLNLGPLNPRKNFRADPPPLDLCLQEAEGIIDLMGELFGGKFVFAVYTGTYCRDKFNEEPFLTTWRRAVTQGGEIVLHTHEEIAAVGTRNGEKEHMTEVIRRQFANLKTGGINPIGFRGGLYGYANFLTPLLEELGLNIDFSAAPGINKKDREAVWTGIPCSAFYLCPIDKTHSNCQHSLSNILEIPIGTDGKGTENENYHYIDYDLSTLETATGTWDIVRQRAFDTGEPQFIHTLFHTFSMSNPVMIERYQRFADYILVNGGQPVKGTEAKKIYDQLYIK